MYIYIHMHTYICIYTYINILIYNSTLHTCMMGASIGSLKYPPTSFVIILLQELRNIWSIPMYVCTAPIKRPRA